MSRLAFHGKVLAHGRLDTAWVHVEDGKVSGIEHSPVSDADETIELTDDQVLLPAATDLHVHCRDWGEAAEDTSETATKAALAGGVTTVCDLSNTKPLPSAFESLYGRVNSIDRIKARVALHLENSYTDFAIHASPPLDRDEIDGYREAGAFALKFFPWDLKPWAYPPELDDTLAVARRAQGAGLRLYAHPEEFAFKFTPHEPEAEAYGLKGLLRWVTADLDLRLKVSAPASVEAILEAKRTHPHLRLHAAPHTLYMSVERARSRIGDGYLASPSLRGEDDARGMREHLEAGAFEFYTSEHTPHTLARKYDQTKAPFQGRGFSSVDIAFVLLLSRTNDLALSCRLYCENPARYLGVNKGVIAPGYDADLVIVQRGERVVDPCEFHSLGKVTPFIGETVSYRVVKTFIRGQEAFDASTSRFTKVPVMHVRGVG